MAASTRAGGEAALTGRDVVDSAQGLADGGQAEASGEAWADVDHAQANEQHRAKALAWLEKDPLPHLLMIRNVLVPLQRLQRRQIWVGSPDWERREAAAELRSGAAPNVSMGIHRTYPVILTAECELEEEAMRGVRALLFHGGLWSVMPESALVAKQVGLAHKLCSRTGALLHKKVYALHVNFPFPLVPRSKEP